MNLGIFARVLISLMILLIISTSIMGVMLLDDARETVDKFRLQQAHTLAEGLAEGSLDALAAKDYELLERWVIAMTPIEDFAYAYLSRADGVILTHTRPEMVARRGEPLGQLTAPIVRNLEYRGRPVREVVHSAHLGNRHMANAHLAYFLDTKPYFAEDSVPRLVTVLLASLLAFGLATYLVLRRFLKPVETLSRVIENTDNFQHDMPEELMQQKDEIGLLACNFYGLMKRLSDSYNSLFREKEFNQVTLDSIGDAVMVTDEDGRIQYMNPVAVNLTGWSVDDAKGHSVKGIFPIVDASTRDAIPNPVEKVLQTGEVVYLSNHTTLISKDGTEYQIADSAAPIRNRQGDILGMVLVFNDVTEAYQLRESARQAANKSENERALLRGLIDSVDDLIYIKDTSGRYTGCNRAYEEFVGHDEQSIIGKTDDELFSAEHAGLSKDGDRRVFETGATLREEKRVTYPDGTEVLFDINKTLFYNADDEVQGLIGICRDVTSIKRKEEQLRQSVKMEALGKLTGGVAHDYNNMLGIIIGYAEMLKNNKADQEKVKKYALSIYRAGERGAALTRKLLAFSRLKPATENQVDINQLILSEQDFLVKTLTARIQLELDLAEGLWGVWLDEGDLEDAILNICVNALHAMGESGCLTISTANQHLTADNDYDLPAGDYVQLVVRDTGKGMDDSVLAHIFDPFFSTKGEDGTGLGLSQVYGFVKRSDGLIKAFSTPGEGTRFVMLFPRYISSAKEEVVPAASDVPEPNGGEVILVVDDEQDLADLYCDILTEGGYKVLSASDGNQALSILEKNRVDMLISDVIMPEMNGAELAEKVQELYPDIRIQLISGFDGGESIDADLKSDMLQKPVRADDLLRRVRDRLI